MITTYVLEKATGIFNGNQGNDHFWTEVAIKLYFLGVLTASEKSFEHGWHEGLNYVVIWKGAYATTLKHEHSSLEGASWFFIGKEILQNQLESAPALCRGWCFTKEPLIPPSVCLPQQMLYFWTSGGTPSQLPPPNGKFSGSQVSWLPS